METLSINEIKILEQCECTEICAVCDQKHRAHLHRPLDPKSVSPEIIADIILQNE